MFELVKKISDDSDVESNSSWTLLSEDKNERNDRLSENIYPAIHEPISIEDKSKEETAEKNENSEILEEDKNTNIEASNNEKLSEDDIESVSSSTDFSLEHLPEIEAENEGQEQGCPTLEEYLKEQEITYDYDYDARAEHWEYVYDGQKPKKRKYNKRRSENLSTMAVVGAVLSLAGISLICMITPFFDNRLATSNLKNEIEKNFTKLDSSYATANNLKVYVSGSGKTQKLLDKVDLIDICVKQSCNSHINHANNQASPKGMQKGTAKVETPVTSDQYLKSVDIDANEKRERLQPKDGISSKGTELTKDESLETNHLKSDKEGKQILNKRKPLDTKSRNNIKVSMKQENYKKIDGRLTNEKPLKSKSQSNRENHTEKQNNPIQDNGSNIVNKDNYKQEVMKENVKTVKAKRADEKSKIDKNIQDSAFVKKNTERTKHVKQNTKLSLQADKNEDPLKNTAIICQKSRVLNEPNFVLVDKIIKRNERTKANSSGTKKDSEGFVKSCSSLVSSNKSLQANSYQPDFIALQLLQDLCMLKLASKFATRINSRQKKLKRRLERKFDRKRQHHNIFMAEVNAVESQSTQIQHLSKKAKTETCGNLCDSGNVDNNSIINFKPKLIDNHFVTGLKPLISASNRLSNFDLLKELPFMKAKRKQKQRNMLALHPKSGEETNLRPSYNTQVDKPIQKARLFTTTNTSMEQQRIFSPNDIAHRNSARFLADTRKFNEERLRLLEEKRRETRLRMEALIRERRKRLQRDASMGIYNIPLPTYADISDKLKQLKRKRTQTGFKIETFSSSDSEPDKNCSRSLEYMLSNELVTALKMGKKVSDTFREWTLKKAPTLTCLKNYCNSKVSQISERLTSQSLNQTNIRSTLNEEELEALRCRKEKHEQLKKFWRSKQDYLDKRIEICELLKKKLSSGNIRQDNLSDENITQGVQILDSIINDVLKSVKYSQSVVETNYHVIDEVKKTSKSVDSFSVECKPIEQTKVYEAVAESDKTEDIENDRKQAGEGVHRETTLGTSDDLYNWMFEKRGTEIKKRDQSLWNVTKSIPRPGYAEMKREMSKQDPSKGYHEKIIKKHN